MAVLNREQFMSKINSFVGEDTSDEALQFVDDMSQTFDSLNQSSSEWQTKYNELDTSWRKKYKERFLQGSADDGKESDEQIEKDNRAVTITFADLFSEK